MKKQSHLLPQRDVIGTAGRKLSLNKKTISNLTATEMNKQVGGAKTKGHNNTCYSFNFQATCYTCGNYTCQRSCIGCW